MKSIKIGLGKAIWSNGLVVKALDSLSRGPASKAIGWFKVDSAFLSRSIKCVPVVSGNLEVKSKLFRQSGSSFEAVEPHLKKGAIKLFKVFNDKHKAYIKCFQFLSKISKL